MTDMARISGDWFQLVVTNAAETGISPPRGASREQPPEWKCRICGRQNSRADNPVTCRICSARKGRRTIELSEKKVEEDDGEAMKTMTDEHAGALDSMEADLRAVLNEVVVAARPKVDQRGSMNPLCDEMDEEGEEKERRREEGVDLT